MSAAMRARETDSTEGAQQAVDVDPDVRARLAALGYVGTFVAARSRQALVLADPKDKIDLFNLMTDAREKLQDAREAPAGVEMLQRVVAKDPQVVDAWLLLGNEYARQGHYDRALARLRKSGARLVGIGWAPQRLTEEIPADDWDIPLDAFASSDGIELFGRDA